MAVPCRKINSLGGHRERGHRSNSWVAQVGGTLLGVSLPGFKNAGRVGSGHRGVGCMDVYQGPGAAVTQDCN